MLFPTFDFLVFLLPVLVAFWALSHRPVARVLLLLLASYFFYMAGPKTEPPPTQWYYAGLLVFSTVLDYVCGHQIHKRKGGIRRVFLAASVIGNLGLLFYFKYTDFFVHTAADIAEALGMPFATPTLRTILPVGISFYTFQSLSYTIDVYRGRLAPEPSFRKFALFVSFFPQLVAGPIVRASELLPQLHNRPKLDARRMEEGLFRIFKGLVKKVILGDWIAAQFTDAVFASPENYSSPELMLGLYAFTLQLYADFSGYSDIAIGVARLLGFNIPENFDRPHQAKNVGEFWRRWHMTLSTWLRDYLFFPLGGSRGTTARTFFNLWLTMFLVGMWHYKTGTSWNFVIYANLQAGAILFNRWNRIRNRGAPLHRTIGVTAGLALASSAMLFALCFWGLGLDSQQCWTVAVIAAGLFVFITWLPITGTPLNNALHILLTFHFTVVSRIFFRAESFDVAKRMVGGLLSYDGRFVREGFLTHWVWLALIFGIAYHFTPKSWVDRTAFRMFCRVPGPVLGIGMGLLGLALMKLMSSAPRAFIYFDF